MRLRLRLLITQRYAKTTARNSTRLMTRLFSLHLDSPRLAQRLKGVVEGLWHAKSFAKKDGVDFSTPTGAMDLLRREMWKVTSFEFHVSQAIAPMLGQQATQTAFNHTLVAMTLGGKPYLFTFDYKCAADMATPDLPFSAIGSGQFIADPFLAFLRRMFWNDCPPSLGDGIFATAWTLQHAIESAPSGIAEPIQIMVIDKSGQARELAHAELKEHTESIARAENSLRNYKAFIERSSSEGFPELEKWTARKKPGPKTQTVSLYPMTVQEAISYIILGKKPKKKAEDLLKEAEKKDKKRQKKRDHM